MLIHRFRILESESSMSAVVCYSLHIFFDCKMQYCGDSRILIYDLYLPTTRLSVCKYCAIRSIQHRQSTLFYYRINISLRRGWTSNCIELTLKDSLPIVIR